MMIKITIKITSMVPLANFFPRFFELDFVKIELYISSHENDKALSSFYYKKYF